MVYRILALDGGGIRGLLTAIWLGRLEAALGAPLRDHFDLVAGTSTGALLGAGVASGIPVRKIVSLYKERGQEIFPARFAAGFRQRWMGPKYDGLGLKRVLDDVFGQSVLRDLPLRLLVPAYDTFRGRAIVFDSAELRDAGRAVQSVCYASAAAPTYFPPARMAMNGALAPLVDGGIAANNPALLAVAAAVEESGAGAEHLLVASFGTGEVIYRIPFADGQRWSGAHWFTMLVSMLFDGASDGTEWATRRIAKKYFRFQCPLDRRYSAMDNASPENLAGLEQIAVDYVETSGRYLLEALEHEMVTS